MATFDFIFRWLTQKSNEKIEKDEKKMIFTKTIEMKRFFSIQNRFAHTPSWINRVFFSFFLFGSRRWSQTARSNAKWVVSAFFFYLWKKGDVSQTLFIYYCAVLHKFTTLVILIMCRCSAGCWVGVWKHSYQPIFINRSRLFLYKINEYLGKRENVFFSYWNSNVLDPFCLVFCVKRFNLWRTASNGVHWYELVWIRVWRNIFFEFSTTRSLTISKITKIHFWWNCRFLRTFAQYASTSLNRYERKACKKWNWSMPRRLKFRHIFSI